jgi:uncharacterized membrane-anchored protein
LRLLCSPRYRWSTVAGDVAKKFREKPVSRLLAVVGLLLFSALALPPSAFAQAAPPSEAARQAELAAASEAADKAGTGGAADVALLDQATLKLPAGHFFIPKAEGARVLRALGNVINDAAFVGLVVGTRQNDQWMSSSAMSRKATSRMTMRSTGTPTRS